AVLGQTGLRTEIIVVYSLRGVVEGCRGPAVRVCRHDNPQCPCRVGRLYRLCPKLVTRPSFARARTRIAASLRDGKTIADEEERNRQTFGANRPRSACDDRFRGGDDDDGHCVPRYCVDPRLRHRFLFLMINRSCATMAW